MPKRQANWRLSESTHEIIRTIAEMDRRSQGAALDIIIEEEARRRGIVVKPVGETKRRVAKRAKRKGG